MGKQAMLVGVMGIGVALGASAGCDLVQGLQPATLVETGGGEQGGAGGAGASTTTAGTGGMATGTVCQPGTSIDCYTGPAGTEGVAMCKGGQRACKADGSGYEDACEGEALPAPETCASTADEDCDKLDCVRWAAVFGDDSAQAPLDMGTDVQGNVIVLGKFKGAIPFGDPPIISAGGYDFFLVKLDPGGKLLWYKQFGDAMDQDSGSLAVDPTGNVLIAGKRSGTLNFGGANLSSGEIFVAKLDPAGAHVWSKSFAATSSGEPRIAAGTDGSAVLWTSFLGSASFGTGTLMANPDRKAVLASLKADTGATEWLKTFVSTGADSLPGGTYNHTQARAVDVDSSGNISILGLFGGKQINLGGADIPENFGISGGLFLARFDKLGNHAWSLGAEAFGSLSVDPLGGAAIAALDDSDGFAPCTSAVVLSYSNVGQKQWTVSMTCPGQGADASGIDTASDLNGDVSVALVPWEGNVNFAGSLLPAAGQKDLILGKLHGADGAHLWSRRFGSMSALYGAPLVATAPDGDILLAASVTGTVDVGTGPLATEGQDLLIARFAP